MGVEGERCETGGIRIDEHPEAISGHNAHQHYEGQAVLCLCRQLAEGDSHGKVHNCGDFAAEKGQDSYAHKHVDCEEVNIFQ